MDILALFSDGTAEKILIDTFPKKESEKGLIIRTSISSRALKESAVRSIQNTCILLEKSSIEFQDDIAICIYGFSNTVIGNSADLAFAIAFTDFLITRGYMPNKKSLSSRIAATGVIDDRLNIRAVNDIKKKILAAIENKANVVYIPEENLKEIEDITKNNPEFCELLKRIALIPVKSLEEVLNHLGILKDQTGMVKNGVKNFLSKVNSPLGKILLHITVLLPIVTGLVLSYLGVFQNNAKEAVAEPIPEYPAAVILPNSSSLEIDNVQSKTVASNTLKNINTPTLINITTPTSILTPNTSAITPSIPIIIPTTVPIKTIKQTAHVINTPSSPDYLPTPTLPVFATSTSIRASSVTSVDKKVEYTGVVLYENEDCKGNCTQSLPEGDYTLRDLIDNNIGFVDNWASSAYISWGYTVQLFDDNMLKSNILNYNQWLLYSNGRSSRKFNTMTNADNEVSSVRVRYGVAFYQDKDYAGSCSMGFDVGKYTLKDLESRGFIDNWTSSVSIPEEWYIIMYENDNFTGRSWRLDYFDNNVTNFVNIGANDVVSSIEVGVIEPE
ncbi:S16 family serine protease [Acetivibrio cellulolyticus]|uniref:S16 family serine protease n=1 Tax=Acetivibrio cellulolyticus TaxID=35830 RepID=UPI0002F27695|nr:S16 family serine protease [Acetivibrio cellulolyticus]